MKISGKEILLEREAILKPGSEEDLVIKKNEYYNDGITKQQIYNYYYSIQRKIIEQLKNYEVLIYINIDGNILKRYE